MCKRWTHCAVRICCTQELKNCNFMVKFKVIPVAITEVLTFGYRIRLFRRFSDYSKATLALLACQPKSLISIAFSFKVMFFYEKDIISVRFFLFVIICFYFVCISRCVTHGVRGAAVIILLEASVLIVRAETPGLANKVSFYAVWLVLPKTIFHGHGISVSLWARNTFLVRSTEYVLIALGTFVNF